MSVSWPPARLRGRSHARQMFACALRLADGRVSRPSATLGAAEGTSRVDPGVHRGDAAALLAGAAPPAWNMVTRCACCRVRQQSLIDVPSVTTVTETPVFVCIEHATPCHGHRRRVRVARRVVCAASARLICRRAGVYLIHLAAVRTGPYKQHLLRLIPVVGARFGCSEPCPGQATAFPTRCRN